MTHADEPGHAAHPRQREHLERQPRPDAAGDDGRDRHRAQAEQQAEARAERGAGEDDEEEDAAAAAGQVEQAQQARATPTSTPRIATVAPFIVPRRTSSATADDHERADERGDERRVAAVGLARERASTGSQNG